MVQRVMTLQEFIDNRSDLPDSGQWSELVRGVPISLAPPDFDHGTIVLNLSKAFSEYVHRTLNGYACFDLGLHVERRPDTIFFPAVSYFLTGERFSETDKEVTETVPDLIIELLTTNERKQNTSERINVYRRHGVRHLWLVDPSQRAVFTFKEGSLASNRREDHEFLMGGDLLPGFQISVGALFEPPEWAR